MSHQRQQQDYGGRGGGGGGGGVDMMINWIKLNNFTPGDLPSDGLFPELTTWVGEEPKMFSSSAQPGCTLLKMVYAVSGDEALRLRVHGPAALAAKIADGPLGRRGDFSVGMEGWLGVEAKATATALEEEQSGDLNCDRPGWHSRFCIETVDSLIEEGGGGRIFIHTRVFNVLD